MRIFKKTSNSSSLPSQILKFSVAITALLICHANASPNAQHQVSGRIELVVISSEEKMRHPLEKIENEIHSLLDGETELTLPEIHSHLIDYRLSLNQIKAEIKKIAEISKVATFIPLDPLSAQELQTHIGKKLQMITEGTLADLVPEMTQDLESMKQVLSVRSVVILIDAPFLAAIKGLNQALGAISKSLGIQISARSTVPEASESIYFSPLFDLDPEKRADLMEHINKRKIPTFSSRETGMSRDGVLVSRIQGISGMSGTGAASSDSLGRKVALDVQHLMMGTPKPEALQLSNTTRIAINLTTAKQLGISFSEEVLENAETFGVNSEAKSALLDPSQVVQEAVASNLSLLSSRAGTLATQEDTNIARSALFPKVDMYLGYEAFDSNLQNASGGFLPNHVTSGTLNFKQPLLSDSSWSNLDVKAHQAKSSRFETITSELDIVNSALRDYVQVLLDHKNVLQEKEDIERTRSNLEVAQAKQSAGSSNLADVYRWESELAQAQSSLLELQATEQNSKTALNQILHRPLGDPFDLRDLDFNNQNFWVANPVFRNQLERADDFLILSQAIVKESISNSPEIKSLNEQVDASQSTLSSSKRKFFVPDLYFNFALSTALVPSDAGVYSPLTAQGPGLPVAFPGETNPQWSATFNLSFNIFNGLGDMAQIRKSSENVHQLELTRNSKQEQVEQSIRKALETTRANYLEIALRQKAAKASNSNYELVRQAYVRGGKSITDLIDAKNSAFTANLNSATATDSFFLSYFSMERALGRFDLLQSDQE